MIGLENLKNAPAFVRTSDGNVLAETEVTCSRKWFGGVCQAKLINNSAEPVQVKDIVLFALQHGLAPETRFYGEGYQMNGQTEGTLLQRRMIGGYDDRDFYRIPQAQGKFTVYNLLHLSPPDDLHLLMAFTSCRRFTGEFRFDQRSLEVVLDGENLTLYPGQSWDLEAFVFEVHEDPRFLFRNLAERIEQNHPRLAFPEVPKGWCSWYCYWADVTEENILQNLDAIQKRLPALKYVQIDDGYQAAMGDWLISGERFPGGMKNLCEQVHARGFIPAIWIGPFIAEIGSQVFREHPDWFVTDAHGEPLLMDQVTFGGWRNAPWYALDGTHPGAQNYLRQVFSTMVEEWGCRYFKLDGTYFGAVHNSYFYDRNATRVEAYRRGMQVILDAVGDSFVLGCNAPVWLSLGLVHGMRISNDINRTWKNFDRNSYEIFKRNWQNAHLWINDPDCLLIENLDDSEMSEDEFRFHASAVLASGGMLLSSDIFMGLPDEKIAWIHKLIDNNGVAAIFKDESMSIGEIKEHGRSIYFLFNRTDIPQDFLLNFPQAGALQDFWTDEDLGTVQGEFVLRAIPPHAARVLVLIYS